MRNPPADIRCATHQRTSGHAAVAQLSKYMSGRVCSVFLPPRSLHIHSSVDASAAMALRSGRGFQRYAQSRDRVGSAGPVVHTGHPGMPVPRSITEDPLRNITVLGTIMAEAAKAGTLAASAMMVPGRWPPE